MSKWRVYNVHPAGITLKDKFRGDDVVIKAGEYTLMDYEDAILFKGNIPASGIKYDAMNQQLPETMKMLKLVPDEESGAETKLKFICMRDGVEFNTQAELDAYTKGKYGEEIFKDEALEAVEKAKPSRSKKTG